MKRAVALAILIAASAGPAASGLSGVVPWIPDQPPTFRVRSLAPPCRVSDLRIGLSLGAAPGGLGGIQGAIKVKHRATARCSLRGTPLIRFKGDTDQLLRRGRLRGEDDGALPRGALRSLGRGDEAYAGLYWSNWCGPKPRSIEVGLPHGGGHTLLGFVKVPYCNSRRSTAILNLHSFTPIEPQPSALPLAFSLPEQRLPIARPGHPFRYLVRVTNASRKVFRFRRCPVYTQMVDSFHIAKSEDRILNCRPVGRLRPHESATFEMVIGIPANAREEWTALDWALPSGVSDLIEINLTVRR
jgi:Domain of unknown function (DUF4232)